MMFFGLPKMRLISCYGVAKYSPDRNSKGGGQFPKFRFFTRYLNLLQLNTHILSFCVFSFSVVVIPSSKQIKWSLFSFSLIFGCFSFVHPQTF